MGYEMKSLLREERTLRLDLYLAVDNYYGAWDDYKAEVQLGFRKLQDLIRLRKRWAGQIAEQRYGDMAYRIYQNDALHKYRQQFDLAQTYIYLTAAAYDYETNLQGERPGGRRQVPARHRGHPVAGRDALDDRAVGRRTDRRARAAWPSRWARCATTSWC